MIEPERRTRGFLGGPSRCTECRILVAELSSLSGGWGLYLTGAGERIALRATLAVPGQPAGLWAREHAVPVPAGKAQALLDRCAELDVLAASVNRMRPPKPDEPVMVVTLWNPDGATASVEKPAGVAVPSIDAIGRAASRLAREAAKARCTREGPLGLAWRPWR